MTSRPVARLDTPCYILSADQNRVVAKVLDGLEYSLQKRREMGQMKLSILSGSMLLVTTMYVLSAQPASSAETETGIQMYKTQTSQSSRQGEPLQGSLRVRPSPKELAAISEVLAIRPRPKTLTDADIKYLKELLGKPSWYGFEQRIVHEIWTEVSGKEWRNTEGAEMLRNKTTP